MHESLSMLEASTTDTSTNDGRCQENATLPVPCSTEPSPTLPLTSLVPIQEMNTPPNTCFFTDEVSHKKGKDTPVLVGSSSVTLDDPHASLYSVEHIEVDADFYQYARPTEEPLLAARRGNPITTALHAYIRRIASQGRYVQTFPLVRIIPALLCLIIGVGILIYCIVDTTRVYRRNGSASNKKHGEVPNGSGNKKHPRQKEEAETLRLAGKDKEKQEAFVEDENLRQSASLYLKHVHDKAKRELMHSDPDTQQLHKHLNEFLLEWNKEHASTVSCMNANFPVKYLSTQHPHLVEWVHTVLLLVARARLVRRYKEVLAEATQHFLSRDTVEALAGDVWESVEESQVTSPQERALWYHFELVMRKLRMWIPIEGLDLEQHREHEDEIIDLYRDGLQTATSLCTALSQ